VARADSTIRVNIIGDAKGLGKELGKANSKLGGLGKIAGGIGIAVATDALLDFGATALDEADRAGDALTRLRLKLGPLTDDLDAAAGGFSKLGQSRQDMLELEAAVADAGTALGIANPLIADFADDAAATAAAIQLLGGAGGADAAGIVDLMGKAAGGSLKAMKALGIHVDEAAVASLALQMSGKDNPDMLTKSELAAARYTLVLLALKPQLDAVALGSADVEQSQADLQARFETLTGKIGEGVEGPLADFLGWTLAGIDGIGQLGAAFDLLDGQIKSSFPALHDFIELLGRALSLVLQTFGGHALPSGGTNFPQVPTRPGLGPVGGTSSQRNVVNAVQDYQERNGRPII
jgi:hypothetical protein